jgi:tetratricopeptide (TPR) repeat protein
MRLFGWVILILLLVAGGGAVFLALDSERSGSGKPGSTTTPAATPGGESGGPREQPPSSGDDRRKQPSGDRKDKGDKEKSGSSKGSEGKSSRKEEAKSSSITDEIVPRTAKEADALLKEAGSLRDKLKWDAAREKYELVTAGKFRREQGYLGLAEVAFQLNRPDDVIAYAKRAGTGIRARNLLGHAHFKKKDYEAALKYYESVLKEDKGNVEAQNGAKAARDKLGQ